MIKLLAAAISFALLLATPVMSKEVLLECSGAFSYCSKYHDGSVRCDLAKPQLTLVSIEGNSITQFDGLGFLTFMNLCELDGSNIQCFEAIPLRSSRPPSEEHSTRKLTLYRTTGRLDWAYESTYDPDHPARKREPGITGKSNKYQAQCKIREHKNLF